MSAKKQKADAEPKPLIAFHWTVEKSSRKVRDYTDIIRISVAKLFYKGKLVHTAEGVTAFDSLTEQAEAWNPAGYEPQVPDKKVICLADLTPDARIARCLDWGNRLFFAEQPATETTSDQA